MSYVNSVASHKGRFLDGFCKTTQTARKRKVYGPFVWSYQALNYITRRATTVALPPAAPSN